MASHILSHFITSKFDELEKDQKEKEETINNLKSEVSYLSEKLGKMEKSIDAQQQYSRRNCLLLHGIEESKSEDTDNVVLEVLSSVKWTDLGHIFKNTKS